MVVSGPVMMCDWTSLCLEFPHPMGLETGRIVRVSPHGEIVQDDPARLSVSWDALEGEGSDSERVTLFAPDESKLWLLGNPCKWLQGHNAYGSSNAPGLVWDCLQDIRAHHGSAHVGIPGNHTTDANEAAARFTRLDLTRSARHPDGELGARAWLQRMSEAAHSRHKGGSAFVKDRTLYFGQRSRRSTLKVYHKADEMLPVVRKVQAKGMGHHAIMEAFKRNERKGQLLQRRFDLETAYEWSKGILRFEVTVRGMEMRRLKLEPPRTEEDALAIWQRYYDQVTFPATTVMLATDLDLPSGPKTALRLWEAGVDPRETIAKTTFYRHRATILKAGGPDISGACPKAEPRPGDDELEWDPKPPGEAYVPRSQLPLALLPG